MSVGRTSSPGAATSKVNAGCPPVRTFRFAHDVSQPRQPSEPFLSSVHDDDVSSLSHGADLAGEDVIRAPTAVPAADHLDAAVAVAAGRAHSAVITGDGAAHTWGCRKAGKLGWGRGDVGEESIGSIRPVALPSPPTFAAAAALADDHTLVLDRESGGVVAFGENKEGQLGVGSSFRELARAHLANWTAERADAFWQDVSVARPHAFARSDAAAAAAETLSTSDVDAFVDHGQHATPAWVVGGGQHSAAPPPATARVAFDGKKCVSIAASRYFSAAADECGRVWTWGGGFNGELGQPGVSWCTSPRLVSAAGLTHALLEGEGAARVFAGGTFCAALTFDGGLVLWGRPLPGLDPGESSTGTGVTGTGGAGWCYTWGGGGRGVRLTGVACGRQHVVATDGHRVWVAGSVGGWEFGDEGAPEEVTGVRAYGGGIKEVAAGLGGACGAVTGDGGLLMFGAPVAHLGRGNLPQHDPAVVTAAALAAGAAGEEVLPGRDGVAVRGLALGGAHGVLIVDGL